MSEVLFEMRPVGRSMRIIAIDPSSGTEVVAVCPVNYPIPLMKRMAARKLRYVLQKKREAAKAEAAKNQKGWIA